MARWYPMGACDESFFADAPHVYRYSMHLPVPPARVWESLTSEHSVADWTPLLKSIDWTSDLGLGATRMVVLPLGAVTFHEYFFRWEEGSRFSFHAREANRPMLRRFGEDYLVEPDGAGSRFTWTFALEGTPRTRLLVKALSPLNRLSFAKMAGGSTTFFANG